MTSFLSYTLESMAPHRLGCRTDMFFIESYLLLGGFTLRKSKPERVTTMDRTETNTEREPEKERDCGTKRLVYYIFCGWTKSRV